jgi:hypothetical protein
VASGCSSGAMAGSACSLETSTSTVRSGGPSGFSGSDAQPGTSGGAVGVLQGR